MRTAEAWFCGSGTPDLFGGVAVIDMNGLLLGVGHVITTPHAERRWQRHQWPPSRLAAKWAPVQQALSGD
jgi:hypothetical protein